MPALFLATVYVLLKGHIPESQWTQTSPTRTERHFACIYSARSQSQSLFYLPTCSGNWISRLTGELHCNKNNPDLTKISLIKQKNKYISKENFKKSLHVFSLQLYHKKTCRDCSKNWLRNKTSALWNQIPNQNNSIAFPPLASLGQDITLTPGSTLWISPAVKINGKSGVIQTSGSSLWKGRFVHNNFAF